MNANDMQIVNDALSVYHASLNAEHFITKNEKQTSIAIKSRKNRFEYIAGGSGRKMASSPRTIEGVHKFIDAFWMWQKYI